MDDDRRRLEAQQTIKRKREEKFKKQKMEKEAKEKVKNSLCRECETYHSPADGCGENKRRKSEFLSSDSRLSEAKAQAEQVRASIFDSRQYQ